MADFFERWEAKGEETIKTVSESAPLTNLIGDRNFGHLDASQKKAKLFPAQPFLPNATEAD